MDIPSNYIIHDIRSSKDFKGITISGYKRKDVIKAYQNSIINNKLEDSIRWCVELHSTGLNAQIWDSLKTLYMKYIHVNNPKYLFYLLKREKDYNNAIKIYPKKHEIFSRNNQEIRNLYAELTSISSLTKKNNIFLPKSLPVINNKSFEKDEIQKRMISKNLDKIINFIFNTTTNEMKLALNEIFSNLLYNKGTFQNCIYWYTWLEKIENNKNKANKDNYNSVILTHVVNNDDKYFDYWTIILWKIILTFEDKLEKNNYIFIKKLHNVYIKNFKPSQISKKKYLFFISFYVIKNYMNWDINIFIHEHLIIQSNANINKMYENIIKYNESILSNELKNELYKNYNKLYYNINNQNNIKPLKITDTYLDENINKILLTNYPEYNELKKIKKEKIIEDKEDIDKREELVFKNMTKRDLNDKKEEVKNKKIEAFVHFISYQKNKRMDEQKDEEIDEQKDEEIDEQKDEEIHEKEVSKKNKSENNKKIIDYYNEINENKIINLNNNINSKINNELDENNIYSNIKNINLSKRK